MYRRQEFREVFDRLSGPMIVYARRKLWGIRELYPYAEDYVQDAFLKLYAHWDEVKHHENLEAWLTGVLKNRIIDEIRRQNISRRVLGVSVDMESFVGKESSYTSGREMSAGDAFEVCDILEKQLTEDEYRLFCMKYLFQRSHARIAEDLGIGQMAAGQRIWRLQKKLRAILQEEWGAK